MHPESHSATRPLRSTRRILSRFASALAFGLTATVAAAAPADDWERRLRTDLAEIDSQRDADIGVYVRDLSTGRSASWKAQESWYLASTIKLPVALAVLEHAQSGAFSLETPVTLRATDYVDGAGPTKHRQVGETPTVGWLMEQMMVWSDNTASDMLIDLVGIGPVNDLVRRFVPDGFGPITTLADVRRHIYGELTPAATRLSGKDFLQLQAQRTDLGRRMTLAKLLHVSDTSFRLASVAEAQTAYYATGLNSGRLDAYGELLARVVDGKVLDKEHTTWLLNLMERVKTGPHRIRAGLPPGVRWAHKTGTQVARTCDSGVITVPRLGRDQRVVVVACTRGERSLASAERALRQVGAAICRSGLLGAGKTSHESSCPTPAALHSPLPASAADGDIDAGVR